MCREKALGGTGDVAIHMASPTFLIVLILEPKNQKKQTGLQKIQNNLRILIQRFFSSYETISFSIKSRQGAKLWRSASVFDHNNAHEIDKQILKKLFLSSIDHEISHLVFEEYFGTCLVEEVKINNRAVILLHLVEDKNRPSQPSKLSLPFLCRYTIVMTNT